MNEFEDSDFGTPRQQKADEKRLQQTIKDERNRKKKKKRNFLSIPNVANTLRKLLKIR